MRSKPLRPPRLQPGSRVALVAPAGPILDPDDFERAAQACSSIGVTAVVGPRSGRREAYLAGTDEERLADLSDALGDDSIEAVWCLRGGYGVPRLLDSLDFDQLTERPKVLIGYSDITALLNAMLRKSGVVGFHGPVARSGLSDFSREALSRVVFDARPAGVLPRHEHPVTTLSGGTAQGRLVGGNLSLLTTLLGTPYMPDTSGALLVLEEVGEESYRIDRMLAHLRLAGVLDGIAGAVVGRFTEVSQESPSGSRPVPEILAEYLGKLGVPAAHGFPVGHVEDQWTLPLGVEARLDADQGTLELMEPAVD